MTRRDFELIARVVQFVKGSANAKEATVREMAAAFAYELARTNPRFDRARFMAACGFKGE